MKTKKNSITAKILILGIMTVTVVMTPGLNKDSLIIPKVIVLFCLAMFLSPIVLREFKKSLLNSNTKKLLFLGIILMIYGVMILVNSNAPFDQLLFGRTGRGLGFITYISSIILLMASSMLIKYMNLEFLLRGLVYVGLITSLYSCLQYFGLDIFKWDSKTNGIIGTLGNPNSQSSFAAMILIPTIVVLIKFNYKLFSLIITIPTLMFTIYISQSTQGYIGAISVTLAVALIFLWYWNKINFIILSLASTVVLIFALIGMLGHGPLSYYLYKVSVQSRGDFWRSAILTGNSHPVLGVGFDSFGDYFLKYRDEIAASHIFAEFTDSAHNFYLDYLATGGYLFLFLNVALTLLTLRSFFMIQSILGRFDAKITSLFCAWLVIQLQSIVNTQTITFIAWNALISGSIIGISDNLKQQYSEDLKLKNQANERNPLSISSIFLLIISLIIVYPYFNSDRLVVQANNTGNGDLLIQASTAYPRSVTKFSMASRALLESGLPAQSLYLARQGIEFNPNAVSLWGLILLNPEAPIEDRLKAKSKILELDPLNQDIKNLIVK